MRLLNGPCPVGEEHPGPVNDVEALARAKVDEFLRRRGAELSQSDHEDLLAYVIAAVFEASRRYDPAKDRARSKGREPTFSDYAAQIAKFRIVDWYRARFGDSRHGQPPAVLSLQALEASSPSERDRLDWSIAKGAGDPQADRTPDLARILAAGGGGEAGALDKLGEEAPRRAPRRARGAAAVKRSKVPGMKRGRAVRDEKGAIAFQADQPPPSCADCADFLVPHLEERGYSLPEARRLARHTTRKVKLRGKLVCRFCDTVELVKERTGPDGEPKKVTQLVPVHQVFPNREARRAAG